MFHTFLRFLVLFKMIFFIVNCNDISMLQNRLTLKLVVINEQVKHVLSAKQLSNVPTITMKLILMIQNLLALSVSING